LIYPDRATRYLNPQAPGSEEKLTVFLELERITHELALSALLGDDTH